MEQQPMLLSKADILGADDLKRERVSVPEWGGDVFVRTLTGSERDALEASFVDDKRGKAAAYQNLRARMCAWAICDESGASLFDESDVAALAKKSASALDRVFSVAQRLAGLTPDDVDEIVGN